MGPMARASDLAQINVTFFRGIVSINLSHGVIVSRSLLDFDGVEIMDDAIKDLIRN
jgi:hypothetical protein